MLNIYISIEFFIKTNYTNDVCEFTLDDHNKKIIKERCDYLFGLIEMMIASDTN
jgi:hypothetical protein